MPEERTNGCRSEAELSRLSDEQLLDYIDEQRQAGHPECAKQAFAVLAFGRWDQVAAWVGLKVDANDVYDVTGSIIESVLGAAFDGKSVGEFVSFLKVVTQRRVADFYRADERRLDADPLPTEHEGEDDFFGDEPSVGPEQDAIAVRECFGRVLETRSEVHQTVVRLYGPGELGCMGLDARLTTEQAETLHPGCGMSEANVHQIWRRFKTDVAAELGMGS